MLPHTAQPSRIPVYLLTGYLGSGKTTLLAIWLQAKELAQSALIINEVGEVGLDQHALRGMVESAALVANACICCTGLPGLEEALTELFWSRLHRKIEPFAAVIIETTGLADPLPIVQACGRDALLRERYRLAGVVTTLSATSGLQVLARALPAFRRIVIDHPGQTVFIVSHKATNRLLLCSLLGIDARFYRDRLTQELACLNVLVFKAPSDARVALMNDISHYANLPP